MYHNNYAHSSMHNERRTMYILVTTLVLCAIAWAYLVATSDEPGWEALTEEDEDEYIYVSETDRSTGSSRMVLVKRSTYTGTGRYVSSGGKSSTTKSVTKSGTNTTKTTTNTSRSSGSSRK